jgi:hypothetical protein
MDLPNDDGIAMEHRVCRKSFISLDTFIFAHSLQLLFGADVA